MLKFVLIFFFIFLFCSGNFQEIKNEEMNVVRDYSNNGRHHHDEYNDDDDDDDNDNNDLFFFQYITTQCPKTKNSNTGLLDQKIVVCNGATTPKKVILNFSYIMHNSTLLNTIFLEGNCTNNNCVISSLASGECQTILNNIFYSCNSSNCAQQIKVEILSSISGMLRKHRKVYKKYSSCLNLTNAEGSIGGGLGGELDFSLGTIESRTCPAGYCFLTSTAACLIFGVSCDPYLTRQFDIEMIPGIFDVQNNIFVYNISIVATQDYTGEQGAPMNNSFTIIASSQTFYATCANGTVVSINQNIEILGHNSSDSDIQKISPTQVNIINETAFNMNLVDSAIHAQLSFSFLTGNDPSLLYGCQIHPGVCIIFETFTQAYNVAATECAGVGSAGFIDEYCSDKKSVCVADLSLVMSPT